MTSMMTLLWLADVVLRVIWTATEDVVRFDAAMLAVVVQGVGLWRLVRWVARQGDR